MDGREQTASEWDKRSVVWPKVSKYQQEANLSLMQIAEKHGGAFLCDGVGLGKTFVGLMVLERLCRKENKSRALFAESSGRWCLEGCHSKSPERGRP